MDEELEGLREVGAGQPEQFRLEAISVMEGCKACGGLTHSSFSVALAFSSSSRSLATSSSEKVKSRTRNLEEMFENTFGRKLKFAHFRSRHF